MNPILLLIPLFLLATKKKDTPTYNPPPRTIPPKVIDPRNPRGQGTALPPIKPSRQVIIPTNILTPTQKVNGIYEDHYTDGWSYFDYSRLNGWYSDRTAGLNKTPLYHFLD